MTKGDWMWSASQIFLSRCTAPISLRRSRSRETALYRAMTTIPASHNAMIMSMG